MLLKDPGKILAALLKLEGVPAYTLAEHMGMKPQNLSRYLKQVQIVDKRFPEMMEALGYDIDIILKKRVEGPQLEGAKIPFPLD